METRG